MVRISSHFITKSGTKYRNRQLGEIFGDLYQVDSSILMLLAKFYRNWSKMAQLLQKKLCPYVGMRTLFGPELDLVLIFLNTANIICQVSHY